MGRPLLTIESERRRSINLNVGSASTLVLAVCANRGVLRGHMDRGTHCSRVLSGDNIVWVMVQISSVQHDVCRQSVFCLCLCCAPHRRGKIVLDGLQLNKTRFTKVGRLRDILRSATGTHKTAVSATGAGVDTRGYVVRQRNSRPGCAGMSVKEQGTEQSSAETRFIGCVGGLIEAADC